MFKKTLTIIILFLVSNNIYSIDIEKIVKIRDDNITLTRPYSSFTINLIKRNFYNNNISIKEIKKQLQELGFTDFQKYLILGQLKTESNLIPVGGIKAGEYYKAKGGFLYKGFYIKCNDDKKLPIKGWKVNSKNQWFEVSESIYKNYGGRRRGYLSQLIAFCEFRAYLKTKKEKEFYDNWKTSYAGAIGIFQFLPLNITKKLQLQKDYKTNDIFKITFYMKAINKFEKLDEIKNEFKSPEELRKCNNYSSRRIEKCRKLRDRLFWYNHSTEYINSVINNAVMLWEMDRTGLVSSPTRDLFIYKGIKDGILTIIKIKDIYTVITQGYHFLRHRRHPAIDIAPIIQGINNKKLMKYFINKNDLETIRNSKKTANCYFIDYKSNKESGFIKRTGNTVVCVTKDGRYLALYAHLKKFNKKLFKTHKTYKLSKNKYYIIAGWLNGLLNYPGKFNHKAFKNYKKLKNIIKVENVKAGEVLGYMGTTGHSTGPHLHWTFVEMYLNGVKVLPEKMLIYLNNFKLLNN